MTVDPINLFAWTPVAALLLIFLAASFYDLTVFRRRRKKKKAIYRCSTCRRIYEELHRTPLARCPQCGQSNEPVKK
jgi:rRNA maturation endonuclease Nob1